MRKRILGTLVSSLTAAGLALVDPAGPAVGAEPVPPAKHRGDVIYPIKPPVAAKVTLVQATPDSGTAKPMAEPIAPPHDAVAPVAPSATAAPKVDLDDNHCGPEYRFWFGGDYLLWWMTDAPLPRPIAVSSTGAQIGNSDIDFGRFNGMRFNAGGWLNARHTFGLEANAFVLEGQSQFAQLDADATGTPSISRPIRDIVTLSPTNVLVTAPGAFTGGIATASSSRLWGAEVNFVRNLCYSLDRQTDLVFGFRYLDLDEDLNITATSGALAGGTLVFNGAPLTGPGPVVTSDHFSTRNQFYGGQIGARRRSQFGPATLDLLAKVALGSNHQTVDIRGATTATLVGGATAAVPGGLLALPGANVGRATTNWFVVVPEVAANVGVNVTDNVRVFAGYSLIFVNNVVRPGDQIDINVNPRLVPTSLSFGSTTGVPAPFLPSVRSDLWIYGLNFGVEVRF